ncbi:hypothetical protein BESB_059010 [Besnoitia besnoiti]|uniref:Uncharacterized protein n=1 Tax=Besnoitia besnoiti TaxID=94643 RepID=A0A2A9MCR6_BESBE|nr:hypothetical protein BESB_059010 [Besnoitia besnoiti]PFH35014.1 hypothetical protein BESB_059010 [Besnoitia besnoiti]
MPPTSLITSPSSDLSASAASSVRERVAMPPLITAHPPSPSAVPSTAPQRLATR